MSDFKTKIGKKLLSILMFSMYSDAKTIYREYIQNASDAIKEAVNNGILENIKSGHISINIDSDAQSIRITDNGTGISIQNAEERLLNIADSIKNGVDEAGQFGIGRLVGAGYCQKLTFTTSYYGEDKGTKIVFDVNGAQKIINDSEDTSTAAEVIDKITTTEIFDEDKSQHYFVVQMDKVLDAYCDDLLNETTVRDYLVEIAPIDYTMPFKTTLLQNSLSCLIEEKDEYEDYYRNLNSYKISLNAYSDIRKSYGLKIKGTNDDIVNLKFFKIENSKYGVFAWGWYAITAYSIEIPSSDTSRGFRLRRHNIQVGNANILNKYFKEARGNNYFYGEIHAIHPGLLLSSSRDGLAGSDVADAFKRELKAFLYKLKDLYHFANNAKKATKSIEAVEDILNVGNQPNDGTKEQIVSTIASATEELDKLNKSKYASETPEAKEVYAIYKKKIDEVKQKAQRQVEIPEVNSEITKEVKTPSEVDDAEKTEDPLSAIVAFYSKETIDVLRTTFELMEKYSRESDKTLISSLKKKIVKKLSNDISKPR